MSDKDTSGEQVFNFCHAKRPLAKVLLFYQSFLIPLHISLQNTAQGDSGSVHTHYAAGTISRLCFKYLLIWLGPEPAYLFPDVIELLLDLNLMPGEGRVHFQAHSVSLWAA